MKDYEKDKYLYRILSGKTIISKFGLDVITPSLNLLYESEEIYCDYYNKKGLMNQDEMRSFLVDSRIIDFSDLDYLKSFQKVLESLQKDLCSNFGTHNADPIRSLIKQARVKRDEILLKLSKYEGYCLESVANYAKSIFLISNTTYKNNKKYNFKKYSIISIVSELNNLNISNEEIRNLAKKSSWCNTWYTIRGADIFKGVPSIEQQLLLMWSKIYDNIKDSPDCPSEELILDNDAIDGWLILQKEEYNKKKIENTSKLKVNSKINNSQEVFIIAKTKEEADRIQKMNSVNASRIQKQRIDQINSQGEIHHHNLLDVRRDVQEQFHRMQVEQIRGKKN